MNTTLTANITQANHPDKYLACIGHLGPYMGDPALFERLFAEVGDWMKIKGLFRQNTESISVYHDDPQQVPPEKQRISVGFTVPKDTIGDKKIQILKIPAGSYALGLFEIKMEEYSDAWAAMMTFMENNHLNPNGLMYESYKNDPSQHPEGKHQVEICVGVK